MGKKLEGVDYHVEGNGEFIAVERPVVEKLPRVENFSVKIDVTHDPTKDVRTSSYLAA